MKEILSVKLSTLCCFTWDNWANSLVPSDCLICLYYDDEDDDDGGEDGGAAGQSKAVSEPGPAQSEHRDGGGEDWGHQNQVRPGPGIRQQSGSWRLRSSVCSDLSRGSIRQSSHCKLQVTGSNIITALGEQEEFLKQFRKYFAMKTTIPSVLLIRSFWLKLYSKTFQ